jgi:RHS repeat-associated protein
MEIEDVVLSSPGTITGLARYGLGARGIDVISRTTLSGNTVSYPLYDAHGNNVGSLSKSGSGFVVSDEKSYDAWGGLRSGTNANGKAAYCANLGHKQDDESGLVYMRARYYEPTSGRFVSEDVAKDGFNWYSFAKSDPINFADRTGNNYFASFQTQIMAWFMKALVDVFYSETPSAVILAFGTQALALAKQHGFLTQAQMIQLNTDAAALEAGNELSGPGAGLNADFIQLARDKAAEFGLQATLCRTVGVWEITVMCMILELGIDKKLF